MNGNTSLLALPTLEAIYMDAREQLQRDYHGAGASSADGWGWKWTGFGPGPSGFELGTQWSTGLLEQPLFWKLVAVLFAKQPT